MEKVYGCGDLDYTSEPISLRQFFNDASLQHHPKENGPVTNSQIDNTYKERMMDMMDSTLTDTEFDDLENICSSDNFKLAQSQRTQFEMNDQISHFVKVNVPKDSDLETHRKLGQRHRLHERFLKYAGTVWLDKNCVPSKTKKLPDNNLIPGSDLLVVVRFYAPFRHVVGQRNHRVAVGFQEITILGSQSLSDLRDSFKCTSDSIICQDLSSNPWSKAKNLAKDKYKSGMIYLGNTFYDDMRCQTNLEYSQEVLKWAKERKLKLGGKAKMEDTKIIDLTVKLGYPYLYQHQGNCEHLFCFSDIRLLHQSDLLQLAQYPSLRSLCRQHSRSCMLCGHYLAKWVTVGNSRVPHDPCYFCESCFLSYNYIDKKKIGNFKAYPFTDKTAELTEMK